MMKMINQKSKKWFYLLLVIVCLCTLYYLFFDHKEQLAHKVFCGAENTTVIGSDTCYSNDGLLFYDGIQSSEEVFEGKYAAKASLPFSNALVHELKVNPGNFIKASIWKKGGENAFLLISDNNASIFLTNTTVDTTLKNGWQKLSLNFMVPPNFSKSSLKLMGYNVDTTVAFYDNLTIIREDTVTFPSCKDPLSLDIHPEDLKNIHRELRNLYTARIKPNPSFNKYSCKLTFQGKKIEGKLSLNSHNSGDFRKGKWVLKFEYEENNSYKYIYFNSPEKNQYLNEWWATKWLNDVEVSNDSINFAGVQLNNTPLGIYQVSYKTNDPSKIVLKWDLEGFWKLKKENEHQQFFFENFHLYLKNDTSHIQKRAALNAAYQFIHHKKPLKELVDIDLLAKYFATINIATTLTGFTVPNYAFIYDPTSKKLSITPENLFLPTDLRNKNNVDTSKTIYGNLKPRPYNESNVDYIFSGCLNDPLFVERYIYYLETFSQENYIKTLKSNHIQQAKIFEELINTEFKTKNPFWDRVEYKASLVSKDVSGYKSKLKNGALPTFLPYTPGYGIPCDEVMYIEDLSVKVFKDINKKSTYLITNYHCKPVYLIGWGDNDQIIQKNEIPREIKPIWTGGAEHLIVEPDFEYMYLQVEGEDVIRKEKVHLIAN